MNRDAFYTLKGYQLSEEAVLTPAMEDYLEMICRIAQTEYPVRLCRLSEQLNVRPPSASKMVRQLASLGYLDAEKYGTIALTQRGQETGRYLLDRHAIIHRFLCILNGSATALEEAEKIEHFLSPDTVQHLDALTRRLSEADDN